VPESVLDLSPLGANVAWPEVDVDDTGNAAVVWQQEGGVVGRRISASGALVGSLQTLSTSGPAINPVVAVAPGGEALAAWSEIRDGSWYATARRLGADGSVGPALTLGSGSAEQPQVAVDPTGGFVVAWVQGWDVVAARVEADAASPTVVLTSAIAAYAGFGMVRVGVDGDGDAVVSYHSGGGARPQVWASLWSRTGDVGPPVEVSAPTDFVGFHHALATDIDGDSILVWTRYDGSNRIEMLGTSLSRTGVLGTVTSLGFHDRPDLAVDDGGNGLVVFHSPSPPYEPNEVGARLVSPSGAFGGPVTITSNGRVPRADARPDGRFTVVSQQASRPYSIEATTGPEP
jgi:hypothetical protein